MTESGFYSSVQYLKVVRIEEEVENTRCYYLAPNPEKGTARLAEFRAGQYLSVIEKIGSMVLSRPYSLASSPRQARGGLYMLAISRVDDGIVSRYIHDNWRLGTEVTVSEPLGHFTYDPSKDAKTVVAAVGGGCITPIRSLAMAIADGEVDAELVLLYATDTLAGTMFQKDLKELEANCRRIRLVHVLRDEKRNGCEHGFITAELIRKYAPEGEYSLFLCGPQGMRRFVEKQIEMLRIPQRFVKNELYGEYFGPSGEADYPETVAPAFLVTVRLDGDVKTITAASGVSLLRSLESAGIAVNARCRSGECGWCRTRLLSGNVYTPKNPDGRKEADCPPGYIHPCYCFPLSDLVIEAPSA